MSNFYHIGGDVYRFEVWNLSGVIDGHVTIYWHRESGKWVFRKHGDYGNLVSYFARPDDPRFPNANETAFIQPFIERETKCAAFWEDFQPPYKFKRLIGGEAKGGSNTVFEVDRAFALSEPKYRDGALEELRQDELALSLLGIVTQSKSVTLTS